MQINKIIFRKKNGRFTLVYPVVPMTDNLHVLSWFLTDNIASPSMNKESKSYVLEHISLIGGGNFCTIDKQGDGLHINSDYVDYVDDLILSPEQLRYILEMWWDLIEAGYEEIVITEHDDATFTLEGRNLDLQKPKSLFSKFLDFIFRRKN